MKLTTPITLGAALLAAAALAAGCGTSYSSKSASGGSTASQGSGGSGYGYGHASASTTTASSSRAAIALKNTSLGRILVGGKGMTIYLFEKDKGTMSTCTAACAQFWPPVTTKGAAKAGAGVAAAKLGTTKRSDGSTQVTYDGHPLYYYSGDMKPGDVTGQGLDTFGGLWWVLSPSGMAIKG
jgi:predicted lipoprotein with Yx(FWY)xxD motif